MFGHHLVNSPFNEFFAHRCTKDSNVYSVVVRFCISGDDLRVRNSEKKRKKMTHKKKKGFVNH